MVSLLKLHEKLLNSGVRWGHVHLGLGWLGQDATVWTPVSLNDTNNLHVYKKKQKKSNSQYQNCSTK